MSDFIENSILNFTFLHRLDAYMTNHKGFIAGGCFKSINGTPINDVDIYFENKEDWAEADDYYSKNERYKKSYENDKVKSYVNKESGIRVELIRVLFGKPEEIISNFDFTVAKFAYYKKVSKDENDEDVTEYRVLYHKDFFEHLHLKRLVIDDKIIRPGSTYERTYKYRGYGFNMCRESKVKLIEALRSPEFNPDDLSASLYDGLD